MAKAFLVFSVVRSVLGLPHHVLLFHQCALEFKSMSQRVERGFVFCSRQLLNVVKLRDATRGDLFPSAEMVISMSREFGVPLTAEDFGGTIRFSSSFFLLPSSFFLLPSSFLPSFFFFDFHPGLPPHRVPLYSQHEMN